LTIAKDNKIPYEIRDISREELYITDEVFLTGTASGIKPAAEIDNRSISNGIEGPITNLLKEKFELVVRYRDYNLSKKWLTLVKDT
jgi:branched-chain amino acid aminotransferase